MGAFCLHGNLDTCEVCRRELETDDDGPRERIDRRLAEPSTGMKGSVCAMSVLGNDVTYVCESCRASKTAVSEPEDSGRHELGQLAFDAYNASVGGLTWDGKPIPPWDQVTERVREGWRDAVDAIGSEITRAIDEADDAREEAFERAMNPTARRKG